MNEILFLGFALFLLALTLLAFRLGKTYIFALIALFSVVMNIFVTKQFVLFGLLITGGNALYGATFLATDMLSEHYGKKEAIKAVAIGFLAMAFFVVATQVLILFQPAESDFAQQSILTLFSVTPRILLGSLLAYAIAQSLDVHLFHHIKKATAGKFLFVRNNLSTLTSQFVDTLIFTFVGLTTFSLFGTEIPGIIPQEVFWEVVVATYVIKVVMAALDTPFLYLSHTFLPKELKK